MKDLFTSRIFKGLAVVSVFLFLAKVAGALKEMVIAYQYGVGDLVDSYFFIFSMVIWLPGIWNRSLTMVYVPIANELNGSLKQVFQNNVFALCLLLGFLGTLGFSLSGFHFDSQLNTPSIDVKAFAILLSPVVFTGFLISYFSSALIAKEKHSNSLVEGLPALVMVIVLLVFMGKKSILPFVVGGLIGAFLQLWILIVICRKSEINTQVRLVSVNPDFRRFCKLILIMAIGQWVFTLHIPLDLFFASSLDDGSLSIFGYSNKVIALLATMGALAISRAILPVLASMADKADVAIRTSIVWGWLLAVAGVLAAVAGYFFAPIIISLLFERGEFELNDRVAVVNAFRYALIHLPFYFSGVVLVQYFASRKMHLTIFYSSLLGIAVKVFFNWLLVPRLGLEGIYLSSAAMYLSTMVYFSAQLLREKRIGETI